MNDVFEELMGAVPRTPHGYQEFLDMDPLGLAQQLRRRAGELEREPEEER